MRLLIALLLTTTLYAGPPGPKRFIFRGDTNGSGSLNLVDPIFTLQYLFAGGAEPLCLASADIDEDGDVDLVDVIAHMNFLFAGGPGPELGCVRQHTYRLPCEVECR